MNKLTEFFEHKGGNGVHCYKCEWESDNRCLLGKCINQPNVAKLVADAIIRRGKVAFEQDIVR